VAELDVGRWEDVLRSFEALGPVRVLVSNGAATVEGVGRFGSLSTTGGHFNVQTDSLDLRLRWRELAAAFAVEKPGHVDGLTTYSVQFFDRAGAAALKVFVNFAEAPAPERLRLFCQLRDRFRALPGQAAHEKQAAEGLHRQRRDQTVLRLLRPQARTGPRLHGRCSESRGCWRCLG
jgi:putative heme degradation protein